MNITLQPITEENFLDAFNLKLKKEQESFVSHPVRSLAQRMSTAISASPSAFITRTSWSAMSWSFMITTSRNTTSGTMMIDEAQQDKGYGKAAMQKVLEYIKTKPFGTSNRIALTCNTENAPALHLYTSLGLCAHRCKV